MFGSLNTSTFLLLLALLVVMWLLQFAFTYRQMRGFYTQLKRLRQNGTTAVGMNGNRVRGRAYAVLVTDATGRVVAAEGLTGLTVFAGLQPYPALVGMTLADVLAREAALPVPEKLRPAFGNAARSITEVQHTEVASTSPAATLET